MAAIACLPMVAAAEEPGFFVELEAAAGITHGSSGTRDGGGFGGGGVVQNVRFGTTPELSLLAGYRFDRRVSAFLSYRYARADVDWDVDFPRFGQTTNFSGKATSNAVLLNVAYDWFPSDGTRITATAGVGASFNALSGVTETYEGAFVSDLVRHTELNPAMRLGASVQHQITTRTTLGLVVGVAYVGGFETGTTRTGNLGRTEIKPYKIDDVWRTSLGVSLQTRF